MAGHGGCFTCSLTVTHDEETASDLPRESYSMHGGSACSNCKMVLTTITYECMHAESVCSTACTLFFPNIGVSISIKFCIFFYLKKIK